MRTIYKYELSLYDEQMVDMPVGAEILCVQMQNDSMYIWALIDKDAIEIQHRKIEIYGNGNPIGSQTLKYIGTVQDEYRSLVWHVFENLN